MTDDISFVLEEFSRKYLSPLQKERDAISYRYEQLRALLPGSNIFQSGSYIRKTAVNPVHDLDVIWVMPEAVQSAIMKAYSNASIGGQLTYDVSQSLSELANLLREQYRKIGVTVEITEQSHSVKIKIEKDTFSIDVVPAVKSGSLNSYGDDIFLVPEIQKIRHEKREEIYSLRKGQLHWILSDPKFYLKESEVLNINPCYRKAVKFIKVWRRACNAGLIDFELQSFHLEQIMAKIFSINSDLNMCNAIKLFLKELPDWISAPKLPDAANKSVFVDSYLTDDVSGEQRKRVSKFAAVTLAHFIGMRIGMTIEEIYQIIRLCLLANLPWIQITNVIDIQIACTMERIMKVENKSEWKYHSSNIPKETVARINGPRQLQSDEEIGMGYKLVFEPIFPEIQFDYAKWRVVNTGTDPLVKQHIKGWRGLEIHNSNAGLYGREERTEFFGRHWVDCFLVKDTIVVGYGRFYVNIRPERM